VRTRKLLALFVMGTAFALTLAEPASAYTIDRSDAQIVITSERLTAITVHLTETITLRSNGQVSFKVDVHNSGNTRKYYRIKATVDSPTSGVKEDWLDCRRVGGDTYDSYTHSYVDPLLGPNWIPVRNDAALKASFNLEAWRVNYC
jgi:hypothetical protein